MSDRTLDTLRRRLEKWELQHLRALAAELAERLERLDEDLSRARDESSRAWESAEFWQRNATDMQLELMEADYTVGLTKEGQIVVAKNGGPVPNPCAQANAEEPSATPASWLESLAWDGTPRIDGWLHRYLGCQESPYTTKVGRYFLIGAVARAIEPGCWFPYCLVLVGPPGSGKSTAAKILGGDWFGDLDFDPSQRDAWSVLADKWIYELSDMGSIVRAEQSSQKSFLDRQLDTFRPPFSPKTVTLQRQSVFIGTTGDANFVSTSKRFWPVSCDEIYLAALAADREQLFAEAFTKYRDDPQLLSRLKLAYTPTTESSIDSACSGVAACPNCRQAIIQQGSSTSATLSTEESNSGSLWYAESARSTQAESSDAALSREKTSGKSESIATPAVENPKSIPDAS